MTKKTLKDMFEIYKPKSPDEGRFVRKHVTIKHADRNGNGDDVFNASNIKTVEREKERHGYDPGNDEKVNEETLSKAQMDKREEIVLALKRDNPKWPKEKIYAIATATAKKAIEEEVELNEAEMSDINLHMKNAKSYGDVNKWAANVTKAHGMDVGRLKMGGVHVAHHPDHGVVGAFDPKTNKGFIKPTTSEAFTTQDLQDYKKKMAPEKEKKAMERSQAVQRLLAKGELKRMTLKKEDVVAKAIEKYMPEQVEPLSDDEKLVVKLEGLSENNIHLLLSLFDSLTEENKKVMLERVETKEGINQLLDFAIKKRHQ